MAHTSTHITDLTDALAELREHKESLAAMSRRMQRAVDLIDNPTQWHKVAVVGQDDRLERRGVDVDRRYRIDGEHLPDGKAIADALRGAIESHARAVELYELVPSRERELLQIKPPSLRDA